MEPGDVIGGRYRLERRLASGGMGAVWTARHVELDTEIAVKFLHEEHAATTDAEARFRREAKAAARLRSPSIVQIFDFGVHEGAAYMAMERLVGEDLGALIDREGALSVVRVKAILADVATGLGLAHGAGIVHRDIKPSNLYLANEGGRVQVKVLDFGIAKETGTPLVSDAKTSTGVIVGSPHYMSPEQARGQPVDPRSDLWSLAVVVYEALTGLPPFQGRTIGEIIAKICADPIPLPSASVGALAPLDPFFAKALCRDPEGRFADVSAFVAAFEEASRSVGAFVLPPAEIGAAASTVGHETRTTAVRELKGPVPAPRRTALWLALVGGGTAIGLTLFVATRGTPERATPSVEPEVSVAASAPVAAPSTLGAEPTVVPAGAADTPLAASASASARPGPSAPPRTAPAAATAARPAPSATPLATPPAPSAAPAKPPKPAGTGVDDTFGIPLQKP